MNPSGYFLSIYEADIDSAVALVKDGEIIAYAEEERFIRFKHALGQYPIQALKYCLKTADITLSDVEAVAINWNIDAYSDGTMKRFYENNYATYPIRDTAKAKVLSYYTREATEARHHFNWRKLFGDIAFPPIVCAQHHYVHAFQATMPSPFEESLCLTIDGYGEQYSTIVWEHRGKELRPIHEITVPHSLGWFYAAFTEYLGFQAYDGEYKVMGLAAYGRPNQALIEKIGKVIYADPDIPHSYLIDHTYIHGDNTRSSRYTDKLIQLLGKPPRLEGEKLTQWHEDLAFAVQSHLEQAVTRLVEWGVKKTGLTKVTIGGGVGLNVKMNTAILNLPYVTDVWANPLSGDGGSPVGAALVAADKAGAPRPKPLRSLAVGYEESNEAIESALKTAKITYRRSADITKEVASMLAEGKIVAWFQGRMEGGPRALGQRSILADPRSVAARDRVNEVIKFREYWRPFCPSMLEEAASRYFKAYTEAPFMVIAFEANERLKKEAPAIVHVDDTSRVQLVSSETSSRYHRLIHEFEKITSVPILLNTSFNIKGEPIVCSAKDALRTFWSTGLDALAIGDFIIAKE